MANARTNGIDTGFVALGYAKVAVLGVVQGITELMPISSTAHMRIVPALFGWQDPGSAFSAAMQLAALAAVISFFWRDVSDLLFGSLSAISRRDFSDRSLKARLRDRGRHDTDRRCRACPRQAAQHLHLPDPRPRSRRYRLHRHGAAAGPCRAGRAASTINRASGASRLPGRRDRAGRRADPRRIALWLDVDGGTFPRLQARGGSTVLLPARPSRHRSCRLEGAGGTTTRRPRCARLVGARRRPRYRQPLGPCRDLGPPAHPRALLGLALRRLPGIYRRGIARGRGDRMAR